MGYPDTSEHFQLGAPVLVLGTGVEDRIRSLFMGLRNRPKIAPIPAFNQLLLIIRLHRFMAVKQGLPCSAYPKASRAELALPRLLQRDGNIDPFPFHAFGVAYAFRTA